MKEVNQSYKVLNDANHSNLFLSFFFILILFEDNTRAFITNSISERRRVMQIESYKNVRVDNKI